MECDLNGFQSIRYMYVNGHVDILYSYNVSFAVQYIYIHVHVHVHRMHQFMRV